MAVSNYLSHSSF